MAGDPHMTFGWFGQWPFGGPGTKVPMWTCQGCGRHWPTIVHVCQPCSVGQRRLLQYGEPLTGKTVDTSGDYLRSELYRTAIRSPPFPIGTFYQMIPWWRRTWWWIREHFPRVHLGPCNHEGWE